MTMNTQKQTDALWDALAPDQADLAPKAIEPKAPAKSRVRRTLEHVRDLPPANVVGPYETAHPTVVAWLKAYKGNFDFYLSLRDQYDRRGDLSEKQTAAIYKAIARDTGAAIPAKPIEGAAILTDVKALNEIFKASTSTTIDTQSILAALGHIIAKHSPEVVSKTFTIAVGDKVRVSQGHAKRMGNEAGLNRAHFVFEVTEVLDETDRAYRLKLKAQAQRGSNCCVCGRFLDNPESVTKGIGPVCGDGYELSWNSDKPVLLQLREKLMMTAEITTWLPKSAIKERFSKDEAANLS